MLFRFSSPRQVKNSRWPASASVRQKALGLVAGPTGILVLTTAGTMLVRMINSMTLTRLLVPEAFGLVGIISSILYGINMLTDLAFEAHVVRHPRGDDRYFQDVIWTIHAYRGGALTILCMLASPVLAMVLGKPELTWPLCAVSMIFAIENLSSLALYTSLRSNGSRRLSILDFTQAVFQTIVAITMAFLLRNVWAIIFAMVAASCFKAYLSYRLFGQSRHNFVIDKEIQIEFWQFSKFIMASSALTFVVNQSDKLILAKLLSLSQYGLYATALNLATAPAMLATSYVSRILYPAYAKCWLQTPDRIAHTYYHSAQKMQSLFSLGAGALIGSGPLIVHLLYDYRYSDAGLYLSILSINTLLYLANSSCAQLFISGNNTKYNFWTNLLRLLWIFLLAPASFHFFGPVGIIWAVGTVELPIFVIGRIMLYRNRYLNAWLEGKYLVLATVGFSASTIGSRIIYQII